MYTDSVPDHLPESYYTKSKPNCLPKTHYTESELEVMYMGTESKAGMRFQRQSRYDRYKPEDQRDVGGMINHALLSNLLRQFSGDVSYADVRIVISFRKIATRSRS